MSGPNGEMGVTNGQKATINGQNPSVEAKQKNKKNAESEKTTKISITLIQKEGIVLLFLVHPSLFSPFHAFTIH